MTIKHCWDPLFAESRGLSTCMAPRPNARVIAHPFSIASKWSLGVLQCLQCGRTEYPAPASASVTPTSEKTEMA